jgi:hypothetical protein
VARFPVHATLPAVVAVRIGTLTDLSGASRASNTYLLSPTGHDRFLGIAVDVSPESYLDLKREAAAAFARDRLRPRTSVEQPLSEL